ncbi:MAG: hypothetical protein U0232_21820 [Thermomicrobiales bacterium]
MPTSTVPLRVAVVQAASIIMDRDATIAKAVKLITAEAASGSAKLIVFPKPSSPPTRAASASASSSASAAPKAAASSRAIPPAPSKSRTRHRPAWRGGARGWRLRRHRRDRARPPREHPLLHPALLRRTAPCSASTAS